MLKHLRQQGARRSGLDSATSSDQNQSRADLARRSGLGARQFVFALRDWIPDKVRLIDQAIILLEQYRAALVAGYSSIGQDGKLRLMTLEQSRDDLDFTALNDIASLDKLIAKMKPRVTTAF
ncbi:hypothetical protein [Mesorhizobium neociceri]|uniref:Uncharacterized protein n=1 Tax=Mesorhizobium neociceri TaxID=1307853 RepID=A0A838B0D5_9HYPH|nr:hypothetical protein [Mesorhizobium neociceri]MBA1139382.1 hypothetical protein [Mesorhizobium neociceri]